MTTQLSLFDSPTMPTRTESKRASRQTRNAANEEHKRSGRDSQQAAVLRAIQEAGSSGATRHELAERLQIPLASVCGRVNTLISESPPQVFQRPGVKRNKRAVIFARGSE